MRKRMKSAAIAAIGALSLSAWAAPFTATLPDQLAIAGNFHVGSVTSPGTTAPGTARLTFELIGYGNIDGFGPRISNNDVFDGFVFLVNDPTIDGVGFEAILNMGGSNPGAPILRDTNPDVNGLGASLDFYQDNAFNLGGLARFTVDFTLLEGPNSFVFNYGVQGGAGEGWGLRNIAITAAFPDTQPPVNGVPEPQTPALMLAGLAAVGWLSRRRTGGRSA